MCEPFVTNVLYRQILNLRLIIQEPFYCSGLVSFFFFPFLPNDWDL